MNDESNNKRTENCPEDTTTTSLDENSSLNSHPEEAPLTKVLSNADVPSLDKTQDFFADGASGTTSLDDETAPEDPGYQAMEEPAPASPFSENAAKTPERPTPVFTETVHSQKASKRKFFKRPVVVATLTAVIMCVLFSGAVFLSYNSIKQSMINEVAFRIQSLQDDAREQESNANNRTINIPGVSQTTSEGITLSNQEIATRVGPSIVGVSNLASSSYSYLNRNMLRSTGSGIIISDQGYIITNNHVIANANELKITLASGEEVNAELIGTDVATDIAVLKINPADCVGPLTAAALGDSSDLRVGDNVLAIGNPLGLTLAGSVTHGIVSALDRKLTIDGTTYNLIQTDAAINSGNSGGALVNAYGEVIGINSAKVSYDGIEGLGFAIPIDDVKDIIEDLIRDGYVHGRPSIGVNIVEINNSIAYYYNLPVNYGLFVNDVVEGGSAAMAGIEVGDIIIAFNGEKVTSSSSFIAMRNTFVAGDTIELTINRDGHEKKVSVKLQEEKPSSVQ